MTGRHEADATDYLGEHVRQAVATDPRTNEQGIEVRLVGEELFVSGEVTSDARRSAVGDVAAEVAARAGAVVAVRNEVVVAPPADNHTTERIE